MLDIMDTPNTDRSLNAGRPFPEFAARYSLFVSCGTAPIASMIFAIVCFRQDPVPFLNIGVVSALVFFILLSSFLMGTVSLFGIPRYGVRPILWRAAIGIAVSLVFGFYTGLIWGFSQTSFRC